MSWRIPHQIGVLLLASSVAATVCPSFFSGDDCTSRQCLNGGYLDNTTNICICPSGYLGIHCEAVKTSMPPDNHFKAGDTSFNIMNVNLYTQYWGFNTYSNIQKSLQNHFDAYPTGYDKYNLLETTGKPELDSLGMPQNSTYKFNNVTMSSSNFTLSSWMDTGLYWCYEVPIYDNLIKMIQKASLKNTVITILTQHPPSSDKHDEAREIAVAFGIRINVLWIVDKTFNRCTDAQITPFKTFVDITGGLFVQLQSELDDEPTINLVSQVLLTHYKPQYVSIQSFDDCSTERTVPIVIDPTVSGPYNFVFLGNNVNPSLDAFRDCFLLPPLRSNDNQLAIFQSPDPTCSSITVKSSGSCTVIVFTNAATVGPLDLAIYTTYVEDQSVDASRYAIVETVPFYPAVHIESSSSADITLNTMSASFDSAWNVVPQKRTPAAFEWISNKTIACDASKTYSLYLNISVNSTIVQRSVRVACVPVPPSPTLAPVVSTTSGVSNAKASSSSAVPVITSTDGSTSSASSVTPTTCSYTKNYATLLFAYASDFDPTTYGLVSRTIGNAVTNNFPLNQMLANKMFDRSTSKPITYTNSTENFTTNCITDQPNSALSAGDNIASDVLKAIQEFLETPETTRRLEGSVIVILVNRLPKDLTTSDFDLTNDEYDQLTNLNVKVFPIITLTSLAQGALSGRSGAFFNKLAAQTNGHYVVASDTIGRDANSDFNKIVSNFMQTAYNQNLLFTRNLAASRIGTNIGVVRIPNSATGEPKVTVTITVSLSAVDGHQPQPPTRLFLGIKPNGDNTDTVSIDFLALPNQYNNSNYYTTTVSLAAGIQRELFLIYVPGVDTNDLLIRMWADGDAYRQAEFMKYSESASPTLSSAKEINENIGAALKLSLQNQCFSDVSNSTATLLITDCNGVMSAKYDSDQLSNGIPGNSSYQFIPFFCSSQPTPATCVSGAESKYDAQFVLDSFSFTQSFQCRPGTGPIDSCKLQDANGNNQCSGVAPFKRGPNANLYDCSNHGNLFFNETANIFRCACDAGFSGDSCEIVNCDLPNSDPLATDNRYHTYTVVVGLENSNGFLVLDDAQELFGLSGDYQLSSVWKYQLMTICGSGAYDMIYSGSDFAEFKRLFTKPHYVNIAKACNDPAKNGAHDLTEIYKQAVKGIGRSVKGIVVYYSEVSSMINVTLDDFITASQPYQQQFFVYAVDETDIVPLANGRSIANAAVSTGGFLVQSFIVESPTDHIDRSFIPALLKSSTTIAWMSIAENGQFQINTGDDTIQSYMIAWLDGKNLGTLNQGDDSITCTTADDTSAMCTFKGTKNIRANTDKGPFYVVVYVLDDGLAPRAQIISDIGKDKSDAVSTSTSDSRTIISIQVDSNYKVVANDGDGGITRNARRTGCTFDWTVYSVFSTEKYSTGTNIAKITIMDSNFNTYTRFFPFGTTSSPACQNGGTPVLPSGSCSCPDGFQGPDCSLVDCSKSSTSNAWSDVCVCSQIDDVACATQYTSVF